MNVSAVDIFANHYFDIYKIYHTLGPLCSLINLFGIFIIFTQTPPQMKDYTKVLLLHLIIGTIFEFYLTVLGCPQIYAPYLMESFDGPLMRWANMDAFKQEMVALLMIHTLSCTIAHLVLFRANTVLPPGSRFKMRRKHFNAIILSLYILNIVPNVFTQLLLVNNQNGMANGRKFVDEHPEYLSLQPFRDKILLANLDFWAKLMFYMMCASGGWISWLSGFGFISIVYTLCSHGNSSKQSKVNVKKILLMLVIQISPSFICYSTAMSWFAWCLQIDLQWENVQVINDLAIVFICIHNSVSVLLALSMNSAYREYLMAPFKKTVSRLLFLRTTGATHGQTSMNSLSIVVQPLANPRQQVELRMFRILPDAN